MTLMQEKAINEIKKMPDDQIAYVIQIIHGMNGLLHKENDKKMEAFKEMDSMIKKGTVTDYEAELAAYRDKKYGIQGSD